MFLLTLSDTCTSKSNTCNEHMLFINNHIEIEHRTYVSKQQKSNNINPY